MSELTDHYDFSNLQPAPDAEREWLDRYEQSPQGCRWLTRAIFEDGAYETIVGILKAYASHVGEECAKRVEALWDEGAEYDDKGFIAGFGCALSAAAAAIREGKR